MTDYLLKIFSVTMPLVLIMDPLGNISILLGMLRRYDVKRQRQIILREMLFALAFIYLFYFAGDGFLRFLSVDDAALRISGGVILFLIALKMIFPQMDHNNDMIADQEPFIVPIAMPLVAGPSLIASVILISNQIKDMSVTIPALTLAWMISASIMLSAPLFRRILRDRGLVACERLMGMVLVLISVQMLLNGIRYFVKNFS